MKLSKKLFVYFFSLFFLMLLCATYFQYQREKSFKIEQLNHQLSIYNQMVHHYIQKKSLTWNGLNQFIEIFPDSTLRITVIDTLGNVLYDSSLREGTVLENHLHRPEIIMARKSGFGEAMRHSHSTGKDYYYLAQRFPQYYIRCALSYSVGLFTALKANTTFLYFMGFLFLMGTIALYFIARNFSRSIDRLRDFTQKVEKNELLDTEITFPNDELGEIGNNFVQIYKSMLESKEEASRERDKLFKHLQIFQEGLGIFSAERKEILTNTHFIQYANLLSDEPCATSEQIFNIPEFKEISEFIDENLAKNQVNRKQFIIEKGGRIFEVQCIVFQDDTFEIFINDISTQEKESNLKHQLTQNISHELKTPVSSILGYMESIIDNPNLNPQRQKFFIERTYQQAQRLSALLQDISMLSKLDEADQLFEKEECSLSAIIDDVLNDVHLQIEQKNCKVLKNYHEGLTINGNSSLLYSIFRNLMDNALAYGGENITIDINCYREDDQFYYFSFSDNGKGVEEKHLSRLFERFYRVDKGRSRKAGGTGLGLSIVKNAILFHNGNISAKNLPTGGLSFIFTLRKY